MRFHDTQNRRELWRERSLSSALKKVIRRVKTARLRSWRDIDFAMRGHRCIPLDDAPARRHSDWNLWREAVFIRDRFMCAFCQTFEGILDPHHIKRKVDRPDLIYDVDNGLTLCRPCHRMTFQQEPMFETACRILACLNKGVHRIL